MFINDGAFYDYCDMAEEYPNYANVFFEMGNVWSDKKNYSNRF